MALLSLKQFWERLEQFDERGKLLFVSSGIAVWAWLLLTLFILTKDQLYVISELQLDKIIHFAGGLFLAGILFFARAVSGRYFLLLAVFVAGALWEIWEVFFLPDQMVRALSEFPFWASDTFFDLVADVLGAYFFADFLESPRKREANA